MLTLQSKKMAEKALFEDLGKATLRGVRKCPKCGTLNGTRGSTCKNKDCGVIFKIPKEKIIDPEIGATKVICNSDLQIYSVKLEESNDSIRCFVHLPIIEGIEALTDPEEVKVIKQSAAMCYAPACKKPLEDMGAIPLNLNPCSHTHYIVNCFLEAYPLEIKKDVVKVIPMPEEIRQEIYTMLTEMNEHLVQKIAKNTVVVKCTPEINHPLGFLHFSVFEPIRNSKKFKILCDCQSEFTKPFVPKEKQLCLHFYLCVCAFASDAKLLEDFRALIQCVLNTNTSESGEEVRITSELDTDFKVLKALFSDNVNTSAKRKKSDNQGGAIATNVATTPSINFEQWLASVTEHINQTMHYQFSGTPTPLVFHVPQVFFDILQQRISAGTKKKRLPNNVVTFTRKDVLPVGVFSKYTWHITNILHVKRIFDTAQVPLEVSRSFIENRNGTYTLYNPLEEETAKLAENYQKTKDNHLIKPLELKTFLKVGYMSMNQKQPTPFIIEWTPDILPKTHVGELIIKFEYGHQRNGIVENPQKTPDSTENVSASAQNKVQ